MDKTNTQKSPSVYIESSVISYFTSKSSNDLFVLAKQHMTVMWWENVLPHLMPYISAYVLEEILRGDKSAAQKRGEATKTFQILERRDDIDKLADRYLKKA